MEIPFGDVVLAETLDPLQQIDRVCGDWVAAHLTERADRARLEVLAGPARRADRLRVDRRLRTSLGAVFRQVQDPGDPGDRTDVFSSPVRQGSQLAISCEGGFDGRFDGDYCLVCSWVADLVAGGTVTAKGRTRRAWSPIAVNKVIATVAQVLDDAQEQGIVTSNVAAKIARVYSVHKDVPTYTASEVDQLRAQFGKDRIGHAWELAL